MPLASGFEIDDEPAGATAGASPSLPEGGRMLERQALCVDVPFAPLADSNGASSTSSSNLARAPRIIAVKGTIDLNVDERVPALQNDQRLGRRR